MKANDYLDDKKSTASSFLDSDQPTGFKTKSLAELLSTYGQPDTLNEGAKVVNGLPGVLEVGARRGYAGIGKVEQGALSILGDLLNSEALRNASDVVGNRARQIENSAVLRGQKQTGFAPESIVNDIPEAGANAVSSVIQTAPSLLAGAVAPGAALPVLFGQTFSQEYAQGKDAGLTPWKSTFRAAPMAAFEVAGEKLGGFDRLAEGLRKATAGNGVADLGSAMLSSALKEIPSEEFTTTGQFLTDKAPVIGINQDATLADYGQQVKDTALATALQSGAMGAGGRVLQRIAAPGQSVMSGMDQTQEVQPQPATQQINPDAIVSAIIQATSNVKPSAAAFLDSDTTEPANVSQPTQQPVAGVDPATTGLQPDNGTGSPATELTQPNANAGSDSAVPNGALPASDIPDGIAPVQQPADLTQATTEQSSAVEPPAQQPKKTASKPRANTLLSAIDGLGGIDNKYKWDISGEQKFARGGYNKVFRNASNKTLEQHIENGDLDEFLPYDMRSTVTDDPTAGRDYLADRIRNGERVLPYDVELEAKQSKAYEQFNPQDDISAIGEDIDLDEINRLLSEAGYVERETAADNASPASTGQIENTQPQSTNSNVDGGQGTQGSDARETAAQNEVTGTPGSNERQGTRQQIEIIVKRRAAANQIGKSKPFDNALKLAKDFMNGEDVSPTKFKNAATMFASDKPLSEAFTALAELAKAPARENRQSARSAMDVFTEQINNAKTVDELKSISRNIQMETGVVSDAMAQQLDDMVMARIDALDNGSDLLGDDTAKKQAVADAERSKDTKRNSGESDSSDFVLTGSNSEADKAAARGAQDLFSQPKTGSAPEASSGKPKQSTDNVEKNQFSDTKRFAEWALDKTEPKTEVVEIDGKRYTKTSRIYKGNLGARATKLREEIGAAQSVFLINNETETLEVRAGGRYREQYGDVTVISVKYEPLEEQVSTTEVAQAADYIMADNEEKSPQSTEAAAAEEVTQTDELKDTSDVGGELGFNKRNKFIRKQDILNASNDTERVQLAVKSKLWPRPDYQQLVDDGVNPVIAHVVKQVYDSLSTKPAFKGEQMLYDYVDAVESARDAVNEILADKKLMDGMIVSIGVQASKRSSVMSGNRTAELAEFAKLGEVFNGNDPLNYILDKVFPKNSQGSRWGRQNTDGNNKANATGNKFYKAVQINLNTFIDALKAVEDGFPAKKEQWQISYRIEPKDGKFELIKKGRYAPTSTHDTEEQAIEAAKELTKRNKDTDFEEPETLVQEGMRNGKPIRTGNVSSDELKNTIGLRAVNFGNWMSKSANAKERQMHVNAAFDAFHDLADILNLPIKAMALDGKLGLAIGAQGTGRYAAHFVPGFNEINLTRTKGAGSLAHEWGHALDHYFGVQAGMGSDNDPFASWLGKLPTTKTDGAEIRPEIAQAFKTIYETMKSKVEDAESARERHKKTYEGSKERLEKHINEFNYSFGTSYSTIKEAVNGDSEAENALKEILNGNAGKSIKYGKGSYKIGRTKFDETLYENVATVAKKLGWSYKDARDLQSLAGSFEYSKELYNKEPEQRQIHTDFYRNASVLDSNKTKNYWATPHELFARAFEMYVADKLAEKSNENRYLVSAWKLAESAGVDDPILKAIIEQADKRYPRGDERKAINKAFETLIREIQTKEDDAGNVALFKRDPMLDAIANIKRQQNQVVDQVQAYVDAISEGWKNAPKIQVVYDMNDERIPEAVRRENDRQLSQGATGQPQGFIVRGNVYIVASEMSGEKDVLRTLFHESLGHYGLRGLYNKPALNAALDRVATMRAADVAKKAKQYGLDINNARDRLLAAEEVLAEMAETKPEIGVVKQVIAAIRAWLRDNIPYFRNLELSDAEIIRDYILPARRYVETGGKEQTASDVVAAFQRSTESEPKRSMMRDELGRFKSPTGIIYDKTADIVQALAQKVAFGQAPKELRTMTRLYKADIQKAMEAASNVVESMSPMSQLDRALVSDVVEKMVATGVTPPEHIVKIATGIQNAMDVQTDELVNLGMLSQDSADRWRGKYLPRFYMKEKTEGINAWVGRMLRNSLPVRGIGGNSLKGRGLFEEVNVNEVPKFEALGWEVRDPFWKKNRQGELEIVDENKAVTPEKVVVWRDWTPSERAEMGENRDALFRFVMGYTSMQNDIALGRLFDSIAKNQDWTRARASDGYVKVPDSEIPDTGGVKRYGNLAGLYVKKEILDHISQYEESSELWKYYRKALSFWKAGKTVLNPVAHVNNVVSNLTMAHFAGVSYWDSHKYIAAIKDLVKNAPMVQEAKDRGLMTGDITRAELMADMPDDIKAMMEMQESQIKKSAKTVFNALTLWIPHLASKPMGNAYRFEDDFFKYLIYRDARKNGLSPDDAVDYATKYIFTYDDLPKGARTVRDLAIPFFAYTYKAVPALTHTLLNYPWRFAAPAAAVWGVNAIAFGLAAGDDGDDWQTMYEKGKELEQEERKNLPPWMQGRSALGSSKSIRLGTDDKTQLPVYMDVSRMIPGGDIFDVTNQADGVPVPAPIMPSNPVLTTIAAMFWNKDTFTGKEVTDLNDTGAEAAKKRAEWLLRQLSPAVAPTAYHFDRLAEATALMSGKTVETPWKDYTGYGKDGLPVQGKYAIPQTFGIKARPIDLERSAEISKGMDNKEIRSIMAEIRQAARLLDQKAISQREYDRRVSDAEAKIEAIESK